MSQEPHPETAPSQAARERSDLLRLADEVLPVLAARLGASTLGELEVRSGGWRARLRRIPAAASSGGGHDELAVGPREPSRGEPQAAHAAAASHPARGVARAPAVGYFSPRPDLLVGLPVRAGDGLGHVEVLGLRQTVHAPVDGILGRFLVEDGQAVEYGQELVRVDEMPSAAPLPGVADSTAEGPAGVPGSEGRS